MMEELRGMEYEERLRQTRLVTLEARRTRADIIEVFKIMKGLEGLNREDFFEMEVDKRTRAAYVENSKERCTPRLPKVLLQPRVKYLERIACRGSVVHHS